MSAAPPFGIIQALDTILNDIRVLLGASWLEVRQFCRDEARVIAMLRPGGSFPRCLAEVTHDCLLNLLKIACCCLITFRSCRDVVDRVAARLHEQPVVVLESELFNQPFPADPVSSKSGKKV
jgi:hypothetical protein